METIIGQLQAIYFENPANLYKVIRVVVDSSQTNLLTDDEIVMTGYFSNLHYDTDYQFMGEFVQHPKYGEQFSVSQCQQVKPSSSEGIIEYLASNRFPGIGKKIASSIVQELGPEAIEVILDNEKALDAIKGLNKKKATQLRQILIEHRGTERIYLQLTEWGFTMKLADRIFQKYKDSTLEDLRSNPYLLVEDIEGIGFTRADLLAETLEIEPDSTFRIMAAIYSVVADLSYQSGDTFIQETLCMTKAREVLEKARPFIISDSLMSSALEKAILDEKIIRIHDGLMIPSLYLAEQGIATNLKKLMQYSQATHYNPQDIDQAIERVMANQSIVYDDLQIAALKSAINAPISIITGGPGTGKTTLVRGLIQLYQELESENDQSADEILLAAPTGRASKRMNEMTGLKASTIHRLLGFNKESENRSDEGYVTDEVLEGNLLIVDEMSMVDTWLMNWLLQAIPLEMKVVLVGDKDQLPSVGPGKVFADLIQSGLLPTIQLEKIYRQGLDSSIVQLAHHIRTSQLPNNLMEKQTDRSFIPCHDQQVVNVVTNIVQKALAKGYDASRLQVLAPLYKGPAGINRLNQELQALINPPHPAKAQMQNFDTIFRVGDKVLQLVNNAEEDVYNGDIGIIVDQLPESMTESNQVELLVDFDGKELHYKQSDLDQLTLAYCCSIHKAQGSEYPLVILPMVQSYGRMLRKDLLYTAVTRAKSSLVLVGNPNSFVFATQALVKDRVTLLPHLLKLKFKDANLDHLATVDQPTQSQVPAVTDNVISLDRSMMTKDLDLSNRAENISQDFQAPFDNDKRVIPVDQSHLTNQTHSKIQTELFSSSMEPDSSLADFVGLTTDNLWTIDPMIGMDSISPYDFMVGEQK